MSQPTNNFQHWNIFDRFSLQQAAMLFCDVDPNSPEASETKTAYLTSKQALKEAIFDSRLQADVECIDPNHSYIVDDPIQVLDGETGYFSYEHPPLPADDEIDWEKTRIKRKHLAKFAFRRGIAPQFLQGDIQLVKEAEEARTAGKKNFVPNTVTYTTPYLEAMNGAIQKFWNKWELGQPVPKNAEVVNWLEKRGVSKDAALAMATIIRHPDTKRGGKPATPEYEGE